MKSIKLTQGRFALVDDYDFIWLNKFKWYAHKGHNTFYAIRTPLKDGKQITIRMHRAIMNACEGEMIDHENHNGLDNQKHNLRFCTRSQNSCNKINSNRGISKYKGVYYIEKTKKWKGCIRTNKILKYFGMFTTELEAAIIYNILARRYHGDFAYTNKF